MKYGLFGASGKMGRELQSVFSESGHKCVFTLDLEGVRHDDDPEVLIDFSQPEVFDTVLHHMTKFKCPLVSGTTGLSQLQLDALKEFSKELPIVQSYNYSKGVQILLKATAILNENLKGWDVEISETHHRFKKDKPSGTAIMLKEVVGKDVPVSSLRLGNVPGDHTIYFAGLGEVISISHSATNRRTFAEGVLLAAEFVMSKTTGLYSFTDVVFHDK
ncbi:MAG: 4-hydroxy-tetrahydrodipicolinate reductase [Bacteroidetes bacterium]|nr:4-hydroxy-tetrahydrodipicolinate reductase [Bacteroidota bacterium]